MRLAIFALLIATGCCTASAQNIAIVDATVYASPNAVPLRHATVLIRDGRITSVGSSVSIPAGIKRLSGKDEVVFAGFWNSHVHFTGRQWLDAAHLPADQLSKQMREMLTHSGFTTVVDTASDPENTLALRRRIERGEV
jgi:imidazolonepropionase-like amidohydrolase